MIKNYKVYIHTTPSGKKYVGMTCKQINARWQNGRGYKSSKYFYRAVLKYGWDNISHEIVLTNATLAEASEKEKELIIEYKSNNSKYGYNRTDGGEIGFKHSKATIEKLRILSTNISEETRKRRSKSATGRKMSKEAIEKSSRTHRKPVNQYSLNGKFIKRYESIASAGRALSVKNGAHISHCCKGRYLTAYGYKWAYSIEKI